ncbi:MAG: hydratase [Burkholderiaceae bacterium]
MNTDELLAHADSGTLWPAERAALQSANVPQAYRMQLDLRAARIARGERPRGFKIGFTNRTIWPRYDVSAPIWGTVWDHTVQLGEDKGTVTLANICQPRIEPECVLGIAAEPPADADLQQLFECLDWVAPGFEIVQSHCADWKFLASETIADGGLHARLLVGQRTLARELAMDAAELEATLAHCAVSLYCDDALVDGGIGASVLDGPLHALRYLLLELQNCPGAPRLKAGDVVTTGTWTDAWPVQPGQRWRAEFEPPLSTLEAELN